MKTFKILSLSLVLCFGLYAFANMAQAATSAEMEDPMSLSAEFLADDITAESLGVAEEDTTFWGKFRLNTRSIFTFNRVKQADIDLKKANIELWTAKKLAGEADNAQNQERFQKALKKYKNKMTTAEKRVENLPAEKKEAILEKLDEHQLKQQQLLRNLAEKLPAQAAEKLETVRTERMQAWYENHKENLEARLKEAIDRNEDGGDFKHLQNLATLEEMGETLPIEAQAKIETALEGLRAQLKVKLRHMDPAGQGELKNYIDKKINFDDIKKIKFIDHLNEPDMPVSQAQIVGWKNEYIEKVESNFQNLDDDAKERFLQQNFKNGSAAEFSKIEILEKLKNTAPAKYKTMITNLNEEQEAGLKTRIHNTSNKAQLERWEKKTRSLPVIRKEIQERKNELPSTSNHQ